MSPPPSRRPYWLLPAFVALLMAPQPWTLGALLAVTAVVTIGRATAAVRARSKDPSQTAGTSIRLGTDAAGEQVLLSEQQLSAHGLILGASGAGKSTTMLNILVEHVLRGRPVIAIDMKGSPEFADRLRDAAAAAGRPFRLWTPDGPGFWNPLQHGNATELKDKLISTERFTEPHYKRAAERYVQTVLQVLARLRPDRAPTLNEVVGLMDPQRLANAVRAAPEEVRERVQDYLASLTPDQLSAIRGLGTRLAIVSESHTGRLLGPPEPGSYAIDVRSALAGNAVVVFSLNSSTYGGLSAQLGALVVQDLIAGVGHRLTLGPDRDLAMIGIDEFSALGGDNVLSLLARGRGSGVCVLLATQELADLDRAARGLRDQVLGNTAVKIIHRQDVPGSARTVAEMSGTQMVWDQTRQIGHHPLLGSYDTGRGTRRQVEQYIVHPNEIKTLPTGSAVVITKLPAARTRTVRIAPPSNRGPELG